MLASFFDRFANGFGSIVDVIPGCDVRWIS